MKKILNTSIILPIFCVLLFLYMTFPINPITPGMYNFHDETQLARLNQFVINLQTGHLPPRLAPDMSFGMGFPLFNFYSPFPYWITSLPILIGLPDIFALKLSFFIALLAAFIGMYFFLKNYFHEAASWLGATLFVTATYFATEVVVRGNLAETWFLALLPWALFLIIKNSESKNQIIFFLTTVVLFSLFTTHNIFSLLSVLLVLIFVFIHAKRVKNLISIGLALLLGSYFFLPSLLELGFTNVTTHISEYNFRDHFLCINQWWSSNGWNFGSSYPGCEADQMSFKVGKISLAFGIAGLLLFLINLYKSTFKLKNAQVYSFLALLTIGSLFMTLYVSQFIWEIFSKLLGLFQFPWRFMATAMFGLSFFGAYLYDNIKIRFKVIIVVLIVAVCFISAKKYFVKPIFSDNEYNSKYNSKEYIEQKMAYMIPEYISSQADYQYWRSLEGMQDKKFLSEIKLPVITESKINILQDTPFKKIVRVNSPAEVIVNVHDFPYWKYEVDNVKTIPKDFDKLGRPVFQVPAGTLLKIYYQQTLLEKIGNSMSLGGLALLLLITLNKKLFVRLNDKKFS